MLDNGNLFVYLSTDPLAQFVIKDIVPVLIAAVLPIFLINKREKKLNKRAYHDRIVEETNTLLDNYITFLTHYILKSNVVVENNILTDNRIKLSYSDIEYINSETSGLMLTIMKFINLYNRLCIEIPDHESLIYLSSFIDEANKVLSNINELNKLLKNNYDIVTTKQIDDLRPKLASDCLDELFDFLVCFSDKRDF
ncbi:hypothetical protein PT129_02705 [Erysipelothrix rhusiopathiae]|nr:hypothetical protein [Erysipelothrix rhusiopathiae]